jgi:CBS domain-containing protein
MTPLRNLEPARPTDTASSVLERMLSDGQNLLPVVDAGKLVGLVRREAILQFAKTRAALRV